MYNRSGDLNPSVHNRRSGESSLSLTMATRTLISSALPPCVCVTVINDFEQYLLCHLTKRKAYLII